MSKSFSGYKETYQGLLISLYLKKFKKMCYKAKSKEQHNIVVISILIQYTMKLIKYEILFLELILNNDNFLPIYLKDNVSFGEGMFFRLSITKRLLSI